MNCYTHQDTAAVAVCKACGRAICPACSVDRGFAVVCSEHCASEASELHQMNAKAKRIYGLGAGKRLTPMAPFIWLLLAAPFVYVLVSTYLRRGVVEWFALIFLATCLGIAIISWRRNKALGVNC